MEQSGKLLCLLINFRLKIEEVFIVAVNQQRKSSLVALQISSMGIKKEIKT